MITLENLGEPIAPTVDLAPTETPREARLRHLAERLLTLAGSYCQCHQSCASREPWQVTEYPGRIETHCPKPCDCGFQRHEAECRRLVKEILG